jgi:hypothetical protein
MHACLTIADRVSQSVKLTEVLGHSTEFYQYVFELPPPPPPGNPAKMDVVSNSRTSSQRNVYHVSGCTVYMIDIAPTTLYRA